MLLCREVFGAILTPKISAKIVEPPLVLYSQQIKLFRFVRFSFFIEILEIEKDK